MKFKQNKACRNEHFWLFNKLQLVLLILYLLNSMKVVLFSPSYVEGNQTLEILHLREVRSLGLRSHSLPVVEPIFKSKTTWHHCPSLTLWPHVFQTHNWTSCRATENHVPLWRLMQRTIWTLQLLHNRPSANERKFNNNTKNRSHSQQTTICSPVPWQQPSQLLLGRPQKSSRRKQFYF